MSRVETDADYTEYAIAGWRKVAPGLEFESFETAARILRLAAHLRNTLAGVVGDCGLATFGDYEVLSSLRRSSQLLTPSELAERLMLTRPGMSGRLDRLERGGNVRREPSDEDGRRVVVRLLPRGRRLVDRAVAELASTCTELFSELGVKQVRELSDLLLVVAAVTDPPPNSPTAPPN